MGPVFLPTNAADTLGYAHYRCKNILPMATNGPSISTKKYCQYACMGPLSVMKNAADSYEWAQCF